MNRIYFLLLFCLLFSCEGKKTNFSDEMIKMLANRGEMKNDKEALPPPPIFFSDAYLSVNDGEILRLEENELFFFYKRYYSTNFNSFKEFLNAVLNDGFSIERKIFTHAKYPLRFKLNSKIEKKYKDLGFEDFFKKYSKETASKRLALNRSNINDGEYFTIVYFFFKNGYDISSDCYLGVDYIGKREDSFKL